MSHPARLVVGIPIKYEDEDDEDEKYKFTTDFILHSQAAELELQHKDKEIELIYHHNGAKYSSRREFRFHCAGYEIHETGPGTILGICIFETWNDAIELTPKILLMIKAAKKSVKTLTDLKPRIFFIGQQT